MPEGSLQPMRELKCDVLIVGGGTGGCAAAMAAVDLGLSVILTEETDWIGGQLTAQAVPPDEHPWIEQFGCTKRYRAYRNSVRQWYRDHTPLLPSHSSNTELNPGGGWVSRLCHEPRIGWLVLNQMLQPAFASGRFSLMLHEVATAADVEGDSIRSVTLLNLVSGETTSVTAKFFIDASELGDLLPLTGTEYVTGAESKAETGEPNAVDGDAQPQNIQGVTWCMALANDEGSHRVIDRPDSYAFWKSYTPSCWPGSLMSFHALNPQTNESWQFPLYTDNWLCLWKYRTIVDPTKFEAGYAPASVTLANWPMNDYFLKSITDVDETPDRSLRATVPLADGPTSAARLLEAKELSKCFIYWLQTEAPRHDGGVGYPGLHTRPDVTGTPDGFAKTAYIRESRRIKAKFTVLEQHVAAYTNPGLDRAPDLPMSVGVGAYRIDLHPSTSEAWTIDTSSLPFQIPLGSLVPVRIKNLVPTSKNLGVTHVTNGCYRLHPVEWNIGEAAGVLVAHCHNTGSVPAQLLENETEYGSLLAELHRQGIETEWPRLRAL